MSNYYGFPLAIGKQLLLMKDTVDFLVDGYVVLPLRQIAHIHSGESQRFHDMIMSGLHQLRKVRLPAHPVALDAWAACVSTVAASNRLLIVDCDLRDGDVEDDFFLGPIVAISDDSLAIHAVSATAEWYDEIDKVPYNEITDIRFGDHYSSAYLKYVPVRY